MNPKEPPAPKQIDGVFTHLISQVDNLIVQLDAIISAQVEDTAEEEMDES